MKYIILFFSILIHIVELEAQNRLELDPNFGQGGYVSLAPTNWEGRGLLQQPDGKLIAYAEVISTSGSHVRDIRLARMHPDGSLDLSFNGGGVVITDLEHDLYFSIANAVLQPDGKILVAGSGGLQTSGPKHGIIVRYMPDGTLDTGFADQGKLIFSIDDKQTQINLIELSTDDKIALVVSVSSTDFLEQDIQVGKLNSNGTFDLSFGQNGFVTVPPDRFAHLDGAALDQMGNFYLLGYYILSNAWASRLIKLDSNGEMELDILISEMTSPVNALIGHYYYGIELYPDGRILLGGTNNTRPVFARLLPDGSLDAEFGESGVVSETFGDAFRFTKDLFVLPGGKILVDSGSYYAAMRLNPDGSADLSFNGNGLIDAFPPNANFGNGYDLSFGVYQQPDGKLLIGGTVAGKLQIARYVPTTCSN